MAGHLDALWTTIILDLRQHGRLAQPASDGLSDVIGELRFDTAATVAEVAAIEQFCTTCLEAHRVQLVRVCLARNRMRAILIFRAPDAESVRLACRCAATPFDRE
jgi:hypothetical protein